MDAPTVGRFITKYMESRPISAIMADAVLFCPYRGFRLELCEPEWYVELKNCLMPYFTKIATLSQSTIAELAYRTALLINNRLSLWGDIVSLGDINRRSEVLAEQLLSLVSPGYLLSYSGYISTDGFSKREIRCLVPAVIPMGQGYYKAVFFGKPFTPNVLVSLVAVNSFFVLNEAICVSWESDKGLNICSQVVNPEVLNVGKETIKLFTALWDLGPVRNVSSCSGCSYYSLNGGDRCL